MQLLLLVFRSSSASSTVSNVSSTSSDAAQYYHNLTPEPAPRAAMTPPDTREQREARELPLPPKNTTPQLPPRRARPSNGDSVS